MVSGEAEPMALVSGEAEPALRGWVRRSQASEVGRGGAHGLGVRRGGAHSQRSSEAKPALELAHLGVGWSCSRTLDYSDESMLMVISSSSSGTLVLVPDTLLGVSF